MTIHLGGLVFFLTTIFVRVGLFPFIHTAASLQHHKVLQGDLFSSLHLWSDLWPLFCTCLTHKASVIVCLPQLSLDCRFVLQKRELFGVWQFFGTLQNTPAALTCKKNRSSCLEELHYQNVARKQAFGRAGNSKNRPLVEWGTRAGKAFSWAGN